jgi:serine/threonine-protein phosphatase 5
MVTATDQEEATALKLKGNKAFSQHDWPLAIEYYSQAIEKNDTDPSFYCNRAQANIKLEAYGYAVADATKAIELDKNYIKVYLQHATDKVLCSR